MQCSLSLELLLRHIVPPMLLLQWVLYVSRAGRKCSQPSKVLVYVIYYTEAFFLPMSHSINKSICTQAHWAMVKHLTRPVTTECVHKKISQSGNDFCPVLALKLNLRQLKLRFCCFPFPPDKHVRRVHVSSEVSGRRLIILPLHCAHTVLSGCWHGGYQGNMGQPKPVGRASHQLGPS